MIREVGEGDLISEVGQGDLDTRRASRAVGWALPLCIYAILSLLIYAPVGMISSSRLTTTGEDIPAQVWDLAAFPHLLFHGHNPFFSLALNFPFGGNLASNPFSPLLALLASPVTLTAGPVAAFNLMAILGFFLSASAMFYVLRKCVDSVIAAFVGGLVYGFGPYMITQSYDHLNLIFVPLPPLILAVVYDLVVRRRWNTLRCGLMLGLLSGAQFLISAEVFADVALLAVIGIVVFALANHRPFLEHWRRVALGLGWALVPFFILAGYVIWYMAFGPQHMIRNPQPYELASFRNDLLGPFVPTVAQRLGLQSWKTFSSRFAGGDWVENGVYLGVPLVFAALATTWFARRRDVVRLAGILGLCAFILSLGSPLMIDGTNTGIPLPFALLTHLPFLQDESASRYAVLVDLFVAILLANGIDHYLGVHKKKRVEGIEPSSARKWRVATPVSLAIGLVVILGPLIPNVPYPTTAAGIPAYFTDGLANLIPSGSAVLSYPYPFWPYAQPDIWSADTELRFSLFGGLPSSPQNLTVGVGQGTPPLLQPPMMQELFAWASYGSASYVYGPSAANFVLPPPDEATLNDLRVFCLIYKVNDIIIDPTVVNAATVERYLSDALDAAPIYTAGVDVFYQVQKDLANART